MRAPAAVLALICALAACTPAPEGPPAPAPTDLVALQTPPPAYPEALACDGVGGTAVLMLTVGTNGRVRASRVVQSSRNAELDAAALEAVKNWQFRAATRNGQPIESPLQVPMNFKPPVERPQRCYVLDEQR